MRHNYVHSAARYFLCRKQSRTIKSTLMRFTVAPPNEAAKFNQRVCRQERLATYANCALALYRNPKIRTKKSSLQFFFFFAPQHFILYHLIFCPSCRKIKAHHITILLGYIQHWGGSKPRQITILSPGRQVKVNWSTYYNSTLDDVRNVALCFYSVSVTSFLGALR